MTTDFKTYWQGLELRYPALGRGPFARVLLEVAEFRRLQLEAFAKGCIHQVETQRRLEALLPDDHEVNLACTTD